MAGILLFCFFLILPGGAGAISLKIATAAPEGTSWMKEMRAGAKEIAARTDGRVTFRFYPGGVMGNDASVLRKIRIGQLHGGAVTGGSLAAIHPDAQIYGLPFFFRSQDEVDYVRKRMDPVILGGLKQRGFIAFGLAEGGFAYLMSRHPLRQRSDLKGRKVWAPEGDRVSHAGFEAIGVSAIPLPLIDVMIGLQTGLVDTVSISLVGAIALQWHTRVKYVADAPLVYLYGALVLKRTAFERLSPQDQAIVQEVMERVFARISKRNRHDNESARDALLNQGIQFITPAPEGWDEMRVSISKAMDALAKEEVFSRTALETLRGHLETYRRSDRGSE
jgi:TRAP-type C4-dicarboxylate transport system substrate-binding protein